MPGIILVISVLYLSIQVVYGGASNYGEYDVCIESFELIKDSSKANLSKVDVEIGRDENNSAMFSVNLTIFEDVGPMMYRIKTFLWNGKKFESLVTYTSKNICENPIQVKFYSKFATIIDEKKCMTGKGTKYVKDVSVKELISQFAGTKTFYGKGKALLNVYSKKGSIASSSCILAVVKQGTCAAQ